MISQLVVKPLLEFCYHCNVLMIFYGTITIEWNGLGQPLRSMVLRWFWGLATIGNDGFDGFPPLVQLWNGYLPSLKSTLQHQLQLLSLCHDWYDHCKKHCHDRLCHHQLEMSSTEIRYQRSPSWSIYLTCTGKGYLLWSVSRAKGMVAGPGQLGKGIGDSRKALCVYI